MFRRAILLTIVAGAAQVGSGVRAQVNETWTVPQPAVQPESGWVQSRPAPADPPSEAGIKARPAPAAIPAPLVWSAGCNPRGWDGACGCDEGFLSGDNRECGHGGLENFFGEDSWFANLKNRKSGDVTWTFGAEVRHRYMDEKNRFRPGGSGASHYDLWRIVPFIDMKYQDIARVHAEAIDASAFGYDPPFFPVIIDENRSDLLQAWIELSLFNTDERKLTFRYGRQFLKYGSQHLISPLTWGNTFRNFEGCRAMYTSDDWDIDAFAVQPVNAAARNRFQPTSFDNPNDNIWFGGAYATYKRLNNQTVDLYWLWFKESNVLVLLPGGDRHTIGARYAGTRPVKRCDKVVRTWDWDFEGACQFGEDSFLTGPNQDVHAGFISLLGGHTWNSLPWSPAIRGSFYWGSGDDDPMDGDQTTFYTLFPLGHAYWGILDNLSGQNLLDYAVRGSLKPHRKLTLTVDWHWFDLASDNDFLYNVAGVPFALAPGERHIGEELDIVGTFTVSPGMNVQLGYSRFFYGEAVSRSAFTRPDADQIYVQTTLTF